MQKKTEKIQVMKTNKGRTMLLLKFAACDSKNSEYIQKIQEAKGLLNNLGFKAPLSETPVLDDVLIIELVNKFLLVEDKFLPETYLRQPGFT